MSKGDKEGTAAEIWSVKAVLDDLFSVLDDR